MIRYMPALIIILLVKIWENQKVIIWKMVSLKSSTHKIQNNPLLNFTLTLIRMKKLRAVSLKWKNWLTKFVKKLITWSKKITAWKCSSGICKLLDRGNFRNLMSLWIRFKLSMNNTFSILSRVLVNKKLIQFWSLNQWRNVLRNNSMNRKLRIWKKNNKLSS